MTPRLRKILDVAQECEKDYFAKHTCEECKPTFGWIEQGLFSGGNEEALPAEAHVVSTKSFAHGTFQVTVRLTYRETFETYGRPPNPKNHFDWRVLVRVQCSKDNCLLDEFLRLDPDTGKARDALSESFSECNGPLWVGP